MSDWKNVQYKDGKYRTSSGGGGGSASALTDLDDVNVSSPSDGQVLKYDDTENKWVNANESGGSSSITEETLYTATSNNLGTYSLSADINNYDFIALYYGDWNERNININYMIWTVADINELHNNNLNMSIIGYDNRYCFVDMHDTSMQIKTIVGHTILKVRGIKYS